ncbi:MAG: hypothetical protein PHC62_03965 [Candidatus Izemoplasmatales bacterium]|nr:hypothetical protein [Candidatus Izemoplasmatales bacterium]
MKNKEVEKALQTLFKDLCTQTMIGNEETGTGNWVYMDLKAHEAIVNYIKQLEQQLNAKDKAFDKACDFISNIGKNDKWTGVPQCENCKHLSDTCWDCKGNLKRWFEHEQVE